MFLDLINGSFPKDDYKKIEELITRFGAKRGRESSDTDIPLLQSLLLPLADQKWHEKAAVALVEILDKAKSNQSESESDFYLPALEELNAHIKKLAAGGQFHSEMLALFYTAYHLALYEYSHKKRLDEVGFLFKMSLANNVDPDTRGQGSFVGYVRRFQHYIAEQLSEHKVLIRKKLFDEQTKSGVNELNVEQLLQPSSSAIVPLRHIRASENAGTLDEHNQSTRRKRVSPIESEDESADESTENSNRRRANVQP